MDKELTFIIAKHIAEADNPSSEYTKAMFDTCTLYRDEHGLPYIAENKYRQSATKLLEKIKQYHRETAF